MNCKCMVDINADLKDKGLELSTRTIRLILVEHSKRVVYGWPLDRIDRSELRSNDATVAQMDYCPFCGVKL
jgi:hypothetical protein